MENKPKCKLVGTGGNVFSIIGNVSKALKKKDTLIMYYKLKITETGRSNPAGESSVFNEDTVEFVKPEQIREYLIERYGRVPNGRHKVYMDDRNGKNPQVIGFMHSFWNRDISHNSPNWFQTDWVTITEVYEKPFLLKG